MNREGCFEHALHRLVVTASSECDIVGDIHAIKFACSHVHHQASLQNALWQVASDVYIVRTPPDPAWLERSKRIVSKTLCRQIDATSGTLVDGEV
eukprot:15007418-Heterocapsa_arctica.AAC.1